MKVIDKRKLGLPIAEGGEGLIYKHEGLILKVFKPGINLKEKLEKLTILQTLTLPGNIVAPIDLVKSKANEFIGYTMREVEGEEVRLLASKKFLKLSDLNRQEISLIILTIAETLFALHKKNIFIGDLNDSGIVLDTNWSPQFIDVDSWSIDKYPCTVAMDTFKDPLLKGTGFNSKTDFFAYAIIAFKSLTRIHPYGGTMTPDIPMLERMNKGISVIDNSEVKVPRIIDSWKFLNPGSLDSFKSIFSHQSRDGDHLTEEIHSFWKDSKECSKHGYYYNKYTTCPICDSTAQVKLKPTQLPGAGLSVSDYFSFPTDRVKFILDENTYLSKDNKICSIYGIQGVGAKRGYTDKYSPDGETFISYNNDRLQIRWKKENKSQNLTFLKHYKSHAIVQNNKVYFVDRNLVLQCIELGLKGNSSSFAANVTVNHVFEVNKKNIFICNNYDHKKIVYINGMNKELKQDIKFKNYGIHYDALKGRWLFIHDSPTGEFYTYIFDKSGALLYETTDLNYNVDLGHLAYFNNTIFRAEEDLIRGYNWRKKVYKEFECPRVEAGANLIYSGSKIKVLNEKEILIIG